MILTISTTHRPATDLGYLLHKNPERHQAVELSFGKAHIVYPEASESAVPRRSSLRSTLWAWSATGGVRADDFSLAQYVNDRPYAMSSFMSVLWQSVLDCALWPEQGTSRTGRGPRSPLMSTSRSFRRGVGSRLRKLFEPLGYQVAAESIPLDVEFPEWGDSRYLDVRLTGMQTVKTLLEHLYVLLPVLDDDKHYWVGSEEVEKLLKRGGDWLRPTRSADSLPIATCDTTGTSPRRHGSARRRMTLSIPTTPRRLTTPRRRPSSGRSTSTTSALEAVPGVVCSGARRVIDLGCGEGRLVAKLLKTPGIDHVVGVDVSHRALELAARRLHLDSMTPRQRERLELLQGSLTYRDRRLEGYDAAVVSR